MSAFPIILANGPRICRVNVCGKFDRNQVIIAQGAHERPLVFAGNDLPGVMLAGAVRTYINRYGVCPGQRAIVMCNNDDAYRTAIDLQRAGAKVSIADLRAQPNSPLVRAVRDASIKILRAMRLLGLWNTPSCES